MKDPVIEQFNIATIILCVMIFGTVGAMVYAISKSTEPIFKIEKELPAKIEKSARTRVAPKKEELVWITPETEKEKSEGRNPLLNPLSPLSPLSPLNGANGMTGTGTGVGF